MTAGKLGLDNRQKEATLFLLTTARPAQWILLNALAGGRRRCCSYRYGESILSLPLHLNRCRNRPGTCAAWSKSFMRDNNDPGNSTACVTDRITSLRADVNALLRHLSEGKHLNLCTFSRHWVSLTRSYEKIQVQMNDPTLKAQLVHTDPLLASDLMALSRIIMIIEKFLRCSTPDTGWFYRARHRC